MKLSTAASLLLPTWANADTTIGQMSALLQVSAPCGVEDNNFCRSNGCVLSSAVCGNNMENDIGTCIFFGGNWCGSLPPREEDCESKSCPTGNSCVEIIPPPQPPTSMDPGGTIPTCIPNRGKVVKKLRISDVKLHTSCSDPLWGKCDFRVDVKSVTWADGHQTLATGGFPLRQNVNSPFWGDGYGWEMEHEGPESNDLPHDVDALLEGFPAVELEIVEWRTSSNNARGRERVTVQLAKDYPNAYERPCCERGSRWVCPPIFVGPGGEVNDVWGCPDFTKLTSWSLAPRISFNFDYDTLEYVDTAPSSTYEETSLVL